VALERRNPLPPGRYWQDIFAKQEPAWLKWWSHNAQPGGPVVVEKAEVYWADPLRSGEWLPDALKPANAGTIPDRRWFLFRVEQPVDWPAVDMGFPTIADETIQTSADTAENLPAPSPVEEIKEAAEQAAKSAATPILWLLAGYLAIKLIFKI